MHEPVNRIVRGEIVLPSAGLPEKAAEVIVRVEDVSRADAPAVTVAEQRLGEVDLADGDAIPFAIEVPAGALRDRAIYAVSAHVDVSGTGQVERGDLVSVESHPVLTRGFPDTARVRVRRV